MTDHLLSTAEAASRLGVTTRRVQALIEGRRLPALKVGGRFVIRQADVEAYQPLPPHRPRKTAERKVKTQPAGSSPETTKEPPPTVIP